MILQALASYYDRLLQDPDEDVPDPGFSNEKIHFVLVLAPDGTLRQVSNVQEPALKGKKLVPRILKVPGPVKRTAGVAANFVWDNTGYVLGVDAKDNPKRAREQFDAFSALAHMIGDDVDDPGLRAVLAFLDAWRPEDAPSLDHWGELAGQNVVFRLAGEAQYVHERPAVRKAWLRHLGQAEKAGESMCLVTGNRGPAARLHPSVKGVRGAQSSGAALVSFNLDAFTSFGKEQNFNSPVSEYAAFAYSTALNHMLARDSGQKAQLGETAEATRQAAYGDKKAPRRRTLMVGDATTLFWTEKPTMAETDFLAALDFKAESDSAEDQAHDAALLQRLEALVQAVRDGKAPPLWGDAPDTHFYVLGLSPNAARLAVRFWLVSNVAEMAERLGKHFADLEIEKAHPKNQSFPSLWQLLIEVAAQRKSENIPPTLGGELMRAVITGTAYPRSLVARIIARIRADQEVTYLRAALLKAYYSRALRLHRNFNNVSESEVIVSLNSDSTNVGYRLGRLFAVLEKAQQDALPGINATIKDRFYGAASATPRSVFPRLIRLAQHHIAKAEYGYSSDNRIAEIMEGLPAESLPAHLDLDGQAMFALGYYHQRNAFYVKKETAAASAE